MQTTSPNESTSQISSSGPALSPGTRIGGCYSLLKDLTKPGRCVIWLANDEVLGKQVTLHFVPPQVAADSRAMSELRQEVKRNRQLIHPNILRVYDMVEEGGYAAVSMDCFEGETLAEQLSKRGRLDAEDLKPWIGKLAETLADAHRIQLFHRDLAPANLYVRDGGGLLVTNFGMSRVILNGLERAGVAQGESARLAYLSPQQLDGEKVTASDDIYGFGVLMHELLVGNPPFTGDNLVPQIRKVTPTPLSEARSAAGASGNVPASWQKLVAICLEKSPEARPRNLAEVLTLLGQETSSVRLPEPVVSKSAPVQRQEVRVEQSVAAAQTKSNGEPVEHGASSNGERSEEKSPAVEKTAEKTSGTKKSGEAGYPPPPPAGPGPGMRKGQTKGALSANFPDLDRPRSKAPLVWLLLAAGIIAIGIYVRNMPDESNGDTDGSVARIDEIPTPEPVIPGASGVKAEPPSTQPETLPDPVPVTPATVVADAGKTPKPPTDGSIISSDSPAPVIAAPDVVPDTLVAASASKDAKEPVEVKPGAPTKPAAVVKPAVVATPVPAKPAVPTLHEAKAEPKAEPKTEPVIAAKMPTPPKTADLPTLPEAPKALGKLVIPPKVTISDLEKLKSEREAAIQQIKEAAAAADAARENAGSKLEGVKSEKEKLLKEFDQKTKTLGPVVQAAASIEADEKKLKEESDKAQAAALEAAAAAEAAKKKFDEFASKSAEKLRAREQAQAELKAAGSGLEGVSKNAEDLSQLMAKAETLRQQMRTAHQQAEQDLQKVAAAFEAARKTETDAIRKANQGKIAAVEKQVKELESQITRFKAALAPLKELGEAGKEPAAKIEDKIASVNQQIAELRTEIKRLSGEGVALPTKLEQKPVEPKMAEPKAAEPKPAPVVPALAPAEVKAEKLVEAPLPVKDGAPTNSLGMKFVPVGDVQFAVFLTTKKDFEAFAAATNLKSDAWRNPGFKQGDDHPVVNVTWREAEAFCKWLTEKERKAGLLKGNESYRLPTDLEWSKAVGLPPEGGSTPEERDMGVQDVYPWGSQWPPPAGAGNYAGEETQTEIPIPNYNDGFANTSPVGKFPANKLGLYDMGGNVWQWVSDYWNPDNRAKTLRGGSWYNGAIPLSLLSSCRISSSPDTLHDTYGFRVVRATEPAKGKKKN